MSTFSLQLKAFQEKVEGQASDLVGLVVIKLAAELDFRSPVGDPVYWESKAPKGYIGGHFRANWRLGVGSMPQGEVAGADQSGKDRDRGGSTTAAMLNVLPGDGLNAGHIYYIANNTPYANEIEHGHSKRQAPEGLVGLTVLMFDQIVANAVGQVKS